jgi:predicted dehydrogenase/threonine dehydrogenase-like Zn-dependent dehydrogenase
MKQLLQDPRTGEFSVANVPYPALEPEGVLVQTAWSVISAGTEKTSASTAQASLIGKARARPDLVQKVLGQVKRQGLIETYRLVKDRLSVPMELGYSCAGTVIAVGEKVCEFRVGDRVACAGGGYASHAEINYVPNNLAVVIPENVSTRDAAYSTIGAIAMQGVRQSQAVVGDRVMVIGLGLIGQLTVQILRAAGCRVIGVDISGFAVEKCLKSGRAPANESAGDTINNAHLIAINSNTQDVESVVSAATGGFGVDKVIVTAGTKDSGPLILAGNVVRDRGCIVIVGAVPVDIPRSPFYEKEVEIRFSRSYGPGRYDPEYEEKGKDYPIGYVRWTERRNIESFLHLVSEGKIDLETITTHSFALENASAAYRLLLDGKEPYMGMLLKYPEATEPLSRKPQADNLTKPSASPGSISVGFIGLGKFAQSFLLPHLVGDGSVQLKSVVNSSGVSAGTAMRKNRFAECGTDPSRIFEAESINTVFVASRHDSHARYVLGALESRKNVYTEKPLCLTQSELASIEAAYKAASTQGIRLMVGYNRRFAPLTVKMMEHLSARTRPCAILYRVNAGMIPRDSWIQDPDTGGGRILGEVCHFVDYVIHAAGSRVSSVYASAARYGRSDIPDQDTLQISLTLADGSVATILYLCDGDRSVPKEWIEISADGATYQIDDFKAGSLSRRGRRVKLGSGMNQDKGYRNEIAGFLDSIRNGTPSPIPAEIIFHGMHVTFAVLESLRTGNPVRLSG